MRKLFASFNSPLLKDIFQPNDSFTLYPNPPDPCNINYKAVFLQIEIQAIALHRLIIENRVVAEEFHCVNKEAKNLVRQALLDSLRQNCNSQNSK